MRLPLAAALVFAACEPAPEATTGDLVGIVVDARDDEPVEGASVLAQPGGWRATSDDGAGTFALALPAGTYQVTVAREGRRTSEPVEVVVHRGRQTEVTLVVPDLPDVLTVRVPVGVLQVGYDQPVSITAEAQDPESDPLTYTWRQVSGPPIEDTFRGQGTPGLTFRTKALAALVPLAHRWGPVAIPRAGQGEYLLEVEVSDGTHLVTGRTQVRSGTAQADWPRLSAGIDGYFDCGDLERPDFYLDSVSPCREDEPDCTPPELDGADTCTPRLRGHYAGAFFLKERTSGRRVLYEVGRWFGVNDAVSGCDRRDCHAAEADGWASTLHASVFQRGIDGALREDYAPACAKCHALGNDVTARNHGFDDVSVEADWDWPERLEPGNWAAMPPELQGVANVQCSNCHGPALFWTGTSTGICAQCHDAPPTYLKVAEWRASPMSRFVRDLEPDDPALDGACTRCHSAQGFIESIRADRRTAIEAVDPDPARAALRQAPKVHAPTADEAEPITCAACHDPHSGAPRMLRVWGEERIPSSPTPIAAATSAICLRCHNAQVDPRDPRAVSERRAPMFGAQADLLYGTGAMGIDPVTNVPHATSTCVDCHKRLPSDPALVGAVGGHTFLVRTGDGSPNVAACADCHEAADGFDVPASGDWDGDGQVEAGRAEIRGLLALARVTLSAALAEASLTDCAGETTAAAVTEQGGRIVLADAGGVVLTDCDGDALTLPDPQLALYRAAFDVMLVERDRSEGLHAPRYAAAALQAAVVALLGDSRPVWDEAL